MPRKCFFVILLLAAPEVFAATEIDGHLKGRAIGQQFPSDSVFYEFSGAESFDAEVDLRFNIKAKVKQWRFDTSYQAVSLYGDSLALVRNLSPQLNTISDNLINDDRRLFDLTHVVDDKNKHANLHRLDRLNVTHTTDTTILRFGRQALSWGNGFFFAPMDIVNPFDPTAVDTEYKNGDDMLYGQWLRSNGEDLQFALVLRRDIESDDVTAEQSTATLKYHGFSERFEYDFLLAHNYDTALVAIGGNTNIGEALWRADVAISETTSSPKVQMVSNINYSWVAGNKNMNAVMEYYFNGFGQHSRDYNREQLQDNIELLNRLFRREVYTIGRHYLAASLNVEMSPLWNITPTVFSNLDDHSGLLQIVSRLSLGDNLTLLGSLDLPMGPKGTEYGGAETEIPDQYLSSDLRLFIQLAWYF